MKNRPLLLILVCMGLGALVWYDNQPEQGAERRVTAAATPQQADAELGAPLAGTEHAPPRTEGGEQEADGFGDQPARAQANDFEEPGTAPSAVDTTSPGASAAAGEGESPASPETHSGNPLASLDKSTLSDWVQRPLFAPSRKRPPETAQGPAPQAAVTKPPPPLYDLMGVVSEKGRAIALLRKKADGTSFRVQVGDMLGGWQVSKVDARAVTLMRDDGTSETVSIFRE